MAFGLSPKHIQEYHLKDIDKESFWVLAIEAAVRLGWDVRSIGESGFEAYTKYSLISWSEAVTVEFHDGIVRIKSESTGIQPIDWGKNKWNIDSLLSEVEALMRSMNQDEIKAKLADLKQGFASKEDDFQADNGRATNKEKVSSFFSVFKPTEGYFISPILINLNLIVFIAMLVSGVHVLFPNSQDLLDWGANFRPLTLDGQLWRLFTSCFLHIGIFHLLLNMYALLYIGLLLEPYLGKSRYLAAYVISGIAASMTSLWWNDFVVSAGASGAIFGLYGVFLALLTTNLLDSPTRKSLVASVAVFVGYNILNGLKPESNIDNAAHIGGLLSGLVIGYAFVPSLKRFENNAIKFSTIGVLASVLLVSCFIVYKILPNDISKYETEMERFVSMESMALEVFSLPDETPDEVILSELKDRGIYYWNQNIKLLESFDDLELPLPIRARNHRLKQYCELRLKGYELLYKSIEEDTDQYEEDINEINKKIEELIFELTGRE